MGLITIIIVALALAMDAFAVSIVSGAAFRKLEVKHAFRMALFFGGFQAFMPLIGSLAGLTIKDHIADYDHWIAFGLLAAVGGKMFYESFKIAPTDKNSNPANMVVLLFLSVATSIDALAVGITLPLLKVSIVVAVVIIGLITFALSYLGVYIGKKVGHFFEGRIEAIGGIVLIALGLKILIEHLIS
ncbi:MAG: manganese efflux pump [Planctomycetes bacterium]|nr:manganese efflux pump [Planctomycetota bacterium]